MRIIFMGTPDIAKECLEAVYNTKNEVIAVVTNPDKPKGRGMKMIASPVKLFAQEKNIPIYQPIKIRNNEEFIQKMKNLKPDIICVVAYGKILPKELLEIPKQGCVNVHGSLLPKYRGAAPIQWAILNGDKTTGITTIFMDEGMDTGDMLLKEEVEIGENETTGELWEKLTKVGANLLVKTIEKIEKGTITRTKQEGKTSIAPMLTKEMAKIDWENKDVKKIKNLVRGLNPIMGAYTYINGKKIKFWKVDIVQNKEIQCDNIESLKNGTVLVSNCKDGLYIKAKDGIIKVIEIQGENAKRMDIQSYLRGNNISEFDVFE